MEDRTWKKTRILNGQVIFYSMHMDDQAEASYKTGQRNVVEWVENHGGSLDGFRSEWKEFLRSEGLDG